MTCEIALMNKEAIALSADSAVTINGEKVYTSVNKLFALSRTQPIGIMTYGSSLFMGIGWETIIKLFRKYCNDKVYITLEECSNDFLQFISSNKMKIPKEVEEHWIRTYFCRFIMEIKKRLDIVYNETFQKEGKIAEEDIPKLVKRAVSEEVEMWKQDEDYEWASNKKDKHSLKEYEEFIRKTLPSILGNTPLDEKDIETIISGAITALHKKRYFVDLNSGIIIAGFGEEEILPSIIKYEFEGMINGNLKANKTGVHKVDIVNNGAWFLPFAQSEDSQTFVNGIHPTLRLKIEELIETTFRDLLNAGIESAPGLPENVKNEGKKNTEALISDIKEKINGLVMESYCNPLMNMASLLPPTELASLAETLVHLSSFRKHVTQEKETVGGDIDVALITKADGFKWIKKKKLFNSQINTHTLSEDY